MMAWLWESMIVKQTNITNKNPRLCRVNHLFEPSDKVGTLLLLQAFHPRLYGMLADMHTANKERPPVPRCWLKKRMLITHIAGDILLPYLIN